MKKDLSLLERVLYVHESAKRGYIIGQWSKDQRIYLASEENFKIGFYVDEVIGFMVDAEKTSRERRLLNILKP